MDLATNVAEHKPTTSQTASDEVKLSQNLIQNLQ